MEARIRATLTDAFGPEVAQAATLENLGGHASLRIYWRVTLPGDHDTYARGESTRMAMVLPEGHAAMASEEGSSSDAPTPTELPFVDVQRWLRALDMPVGAIDHIDMPRGVLILEDLGPTCFENLYLDLIENFGADMAARRKPTEQLYHGAINLLVDLQRTVSQARVDPALDPPDTIATTRGFDRELLRWELDHYYEWGLVKHYDDPALARHEDDFARAFDELVDAIVELPTTIGLRDYQSRNLMYKHEKLVLIDFQDALEAPFIYDLVALLRDSYIELPYVMVRRLVTHYAHQGYAAGLTWCDDDGEVQRAFDLQTVQRKLKDAGRFIYIDKVKGNPDFLPYYTPSIGYVRQALGALPEFAELADLIEEFDPAWHA